MTTIQKQAVSPIAHLTEADIEQIGTELDAIRQDVLDSRGADDAAYIRRLIDTQRKLELGSRAVLLFSIFPPAWLLGTAGLSVAKILDNMEIGHNILHGQWDWMRDPKIHSSTWEWDMASPSEQWKHSHNELHHTYTNVIGKDNDLGYGIMRVDELADVCRVVGAAAVEDVLTDGVELDADLLDVGLGEVRDRALRLLLDRGHVNLLGGVSEVSGRGGTRRRRR